MLNQTPPEDENSDEGPEGPFMAGVFSRKELAIQLFVYAVAATALTVAASWFVDFINATL